MKRYWKLFSVMISVALLSAAAVVFFYMQDDPAQAQAGQMVGYVDSDEILSAFQPAIKVNMELNELRKKSEEELKKKVREKYGDKDISTLPEQAQIEIQRMLEQADDQYKKDMERLQGQKWAPVVDQVNEVIRKVGMEYKVQVVLEKGVVLYGGIDLTDEVIKKLPQQ